MFDHRHSGTPPTGPMNRRQRNHSCVTTTARVASSQQKLQREEATMTTATAPEVRSTAFRVEIRTSIEIDAAPEIVWGVLTDTAAYPEWNGFIVEWSGELSLGARQNVLLQPAGGKPQRFRPQ